MKNFAREIIIKWENVIVSIAKFKVSLDAVYRGTGE